MPKVFINQIETAVPAHDVHSKFIDYTTRALQSEREQKLFKRLAQKSQIDTRYSVLTPAKNPKEMDENGLYRAKGFASTEVRMQLYKENAFPLAAQALRNVFTKFEPQSFTHLIVTSCTGFYAPGLDLQVQREFNMSPHLERSIIGFMGCYAAVNAMRSASNAVHANPKARVLVINLELCTLHLQQTSELDKLLGFLQFADGCAATVISAEPQGIELESFHTDVARAESEMITWDIADDGFHMHLASEVPQALGAVLPAMMERWMGNEWRETKLWAVHPGGRSIVDAVQDKLQLPNEALNSARSVLRRFGNMSSATVMFVLRELLVDPSLRGSGLGMAFGPGLTMEAFRFNKK